jgi:peptidase S24-like protein
MNSSTSILGEANALKCELATEVLRSSGMLHLRVTGSSMLPTIMSGDTLAIQRSSIQRSSQDAVSVGDIVLFGRDRRLFVHRVVAKSAPQHGTVVTRGDAMPVLDLPVSEADLLGRVTLILRNGNAVKPRRTLRFSEGVIAFLARRSTSAIRLVVGIHCLLQSFRQSQMRATQIQSSQP